MRYYIPLFIVLVILLAGCGQQASEDQTGEAPPEAPPADPASETNDPATAPEPEAQTTSTVKEFALTASKWDFAPSTITVTKGDTVKLTITSTDVKHGIAIPVYSINEDLPVGEEVEIEFVADQAGTFPFRCSVSCGSGHSDMTGTLIVEEG